MRASRREANSEYRLRTSRSCWSCQSLERAETLISAYACPDGVDNVSSSALQALASICDQDGELRVLVENLLDAAVVAAGLPAWRQLFLVIFVAFGRGSRRGIVAGLVGFLRRLRNVILRIYDFPVAVSIVRGRVKGDILEHGGTIGNRMEKTRRIKLYAHSCDVGEVGFAMDEENESLLSKLSP